MSLAGLGLLLPRWPRRLSPLRRTSSRPPQRNTEPPELQKQPPTPSRRPRRLTPQSPFHPPPHIRRPPILRLCRPARLVISLSRNTVRLLALQPITAANIRWLPL